MLVSVVRPATTISSAMPLGASRAVAMRAPDMRSSSSPAPNASVASTTGKTSQQTSSVSTATARGR